MSGGSSSAVVWSTRLERAAWQADFPRRPDDPRLGEVVRFWQGGDLGLRAGQAVIMGFPVDEGVRRNQGRIGAARAPAEIRRHLYRLTPADPSTGADLAVSPPFDVGDIRSGGSLEEAQQALSQVVGEVLKAGAVPVVLGGGHETAYGHFLGYAALSSGVGVINIDAHLDVRPMVEGQGHSGSPFRQMLEYASRPLNGEKYVCLGCQPQATSKTHYDYVRAHGGVVYWANDIEGRVVETLTCELHRLGNSGLPVYVSLDADCVALANVPGVSAPNPAGLRGSEILSAARVAGRSTAVTSFDLVELNPAVDVDGHSARWGALAIWNFLVGFAERMAPERSRRIG